MKLAIVIPAYNEERTLGHVLNSLPKKIQGIDEIKVIVVDDGSQDRTYEIAKWNNTIVIKHIVNLGVGAATITGFETARMLNSDIIVTLDADGQHNPSDIIRLLQPIQNGEADLVIGNRMANTKNMPYIKKLGNWTMNIITYIVFRQWSNDSQSGMKAFSKKAIENIELHSTGYEICSEIIGEVKRNKLRMKEQMIDTIYTDDSKIKGQNFINGINILTRIISIKFSGEK